MKDQARIAHLVSEVNSPKSKLMQIARELESAGAKKATVQALERILFKLEAWQHRK